MRSLLGFTNKTMRFASMLLLFFTLNVAAFQNGAVPPPPTGNLESNQRCPTCPPGFPIDDYLPYLALFAILFGIYKAHQIQKKKALKN